jgi:hypothetical protein
VPAVRDQADAAITVATAQRFALGQALGAIIRDWAIAGRSTVPRVSYRYSRASTRIARPGRNFNGPIC